MFSDTKAFSGCSVDDIARAREFYGEVLGLPTDLISSEQGLMTAKLAGGGELFIYAKPDHEPAGYTVLNFQVGDIDAAVDGLAERGVEIDRPEGFEFDEKGIARSAGGEGGPSIAWFRDPAGNVLSVLEQPG